MEYRARSAFSQPNDFRSSNRNLLRLKAFSSLEWCFRKRPSPAVGQPVDRAISWSNRRETNEEKVRFFRVLKTKCPLAIKGQFFAKPEFNVSTSVGFWREISEDAIATEPCFRGQTPEEFQAAASSDCRRRKWITAHRSSFCGLDGTNGSN